MTGNPPLPDVITFCCPACQVKLTVPVRLAGIEGPCPSCFQAIRAPRQPAVEPPVAMVPEPVVHRPVPVLEAPMDKTAYLPPPVLNEAAVLPPPAVPPRAAEVDEWMPPDWTNAPVLPVFPPRQAKAASIPEAVIMPEKRGVILPQDFDDVQSDRGFKARLAIRPPEDPPDDTWKARHRDQNRGRRRVRRAERAAQSFLESRSFRVARAGLILVSGAMLTWLVLHMKDNQWRLPGMRAPIAEGNRARPAVPPLQPAASVVPGDDDAELPAAADEIPSRTDGAANLAAPLR